MDILDRIRVAYFRRRMGLSAFSHWVREDSKYWKSENEKGGMK